MKKKINNKENPDLKEKNNYYSLIKENDLTEEENQEKILLFE